MAGLLGTVVYLLAELTYVLFGHPCARPPHGTGGDERGDKQNDAKASTHAPAQTYPALRRYWLVSPGLLRRWNSNVKAHRTAPSMTPRASPAIAP
jgi:hypothetical protein